MREDPSGWKGQGDVKNTPDVLKAPETLAEKFLVLGNEALSGHGDLGVISRQCSRLSRSLSGRVEVGAQSEVVYVKVLKALWVCKWLAGGLQSEGWDGK